MTAKPQIGAITTGTLNVRDLVTTYQEELRRLGREDLVILNSNYPHGAPAFASYWHSDKAYQDMERLAEALHELALPYMYFGALQGDGADIGFWVDDLMLDDGIHDGEVSTVSDLNEIDKHTADVVLHVNDHGNRTLYELNYNSGEYDEVWSVV